MKLNRGKELIIKKNQSLSPIKSEAGLPVELADRFELYPENKRRPVNKTLFRNDYFQLTCNMRDHSMAISSRGDLVYSAIPYDTARNYIQRAAIQYLLHPEEVRHYIEMHKPNIEQYLVLSIFQVTKKRVSKDSPEVVQAYNAIVQNPLLEIQVLGRLLQHDETGPLSANLAGKFLFSENVKTGIAGYVSEYLNFVVQLTQALPLTTDGKNMKLLESTISDASLDDEMHKQLTFDSDIAPALDLLPQEVKQNIERSIINTTQPMLTNNQPLLRSEFGKELSDVRKNYVAHSVDPQELKQYFENVLPTESTNIVNVVSDMHIIDGKFPFSNKHFNILAGDVMDSHMTNEKISGIYVIGNHELAAVLPENPDVNSEEWQKWAPFSNYEWFKLIRESPDDAWPLLPVGDHQYYEVVKSEIEKRFPKMQVLNNSSTVHGGIRYIGLTIPVALVKRRKKLQSFILKSLKKLLGKEQDIPTVIVSHAPLFNELSRLSPRSKSYSKEYVCTEPAIEQLFEQYNIIGAIHGHHHIPAAFGRYKVVEFAGKERFVVCSIYSDMNTGFELMSLIDGSLEN
ncbi:metallophosphoesterase [Enterococcus sp. BWM-S5]|uniref:Metallophosphoesterase n=1 Tax=Enterococcus larvae TaxID=2794352 RepID=A0ABS4CPJ2_9ENTE|nr:metallophosphoesterase [Enterococcus larvae]MBP1047980.1 metallophosphoesterase [Enterococcus larvae]